MTEPEHGIEGDDKTPAPEPDQWHHRDDCPDLGICERHAITSAL